jgi:hypothetical protein
VGDVRLATREEVVEAYDLVAVVDQAITQMTAQEAGAAGDKDSHDWKEVGLRGQTP